jgi:hypothetical protein
MPVMTGSAAARTVGLVVGLVLAGCGGGQRAAPGPTTATTTTTTTTTSTTVPPATIEAVTADDLPSSWRPGCPVGPEDLRRITVPFVGFDGTEHTGVLVVAADWAEPLIGVFRQLHDAGYPIERMEPVDAYGGSDDASMAVDNTSAFNCRPVTGGTGWSRHAYGTAIDLNPRENPYLLGDQVLPPEGRAFVDRPPAPGVILDGDPRGGRSSTARRRRA